ncbi:MAG: hypothetical protein H6R19_1349, partial [Proteobacteria bacterium]|nr:hypothetical protein [Pseudomonadota bacterium]
MNAVPFRVEGPEALPAARTEAVLRRLPSWFGREESLQEYAQHAACLPCFAIFVQARLVGFASLRQHFDAAWEIDCLALDPDLHGQGLGRRLLEACEKWLVAQGASLVQVKTLAATHKSPEYAATRAFYARMDLLLARKGNASSARCLMHDAAA